MKRTILFLAANPKGTTPLRLDEEVREIDAGLQRSKQRDQFVLEQKWAVRPRDIQRAMLDINPEIVHFSGHGTGDEGLVFEDETGQAQLVDGEALAGLFELFAGQVQSVVLNGCYSEVQAEAIAQHVNYVIGMKKAIPDRAAIEFAVGFYDALGSGRTVEFAYKFGCAAIRLAGLSEQLTPILNKKPNIEPSLTKIQILDPLNNTPVEQHQNIEGKLTAQEATGKKVWIVVHAMLNNTYYVQQSTNIDSDGTFQRMVYIGDENTPPNSPFQIHAVVNSDEVLSEGQTLDHWPKAQWSSEIISVYRNNRK